MILPIDNPRNYVPCLITETTEAELTELAATQDVLVHRSRIIDAVYVVTPLTAFVAPAVPALAMSRPLWCDKCQKVTTQTLQLIHGWTHYVCECGEETIYYVVTKDGKL